MNKQEQLQEPACWSHWETKDQDKKQFFQQLQKVTKCKEISTSKKEIGL